MCMLSYLPPGVLADEGELWNGAAVNPDGHGWAIVNAYRGQITIRRSMDVDEALESFVKEREINDSGPALFHSRIATSGKVDITGVHPFYVGRDRRTVVAHNGVLFDPGKQSPKSDTALFAEHILPQYRNLDRGRTIRQLERYAGSWNKLAILTVNPARKQHAYLINEEAGYWSGTSGIWHSTWDYMPYTRTTSGKVTWSHGTLWSPDDVPAYDGECDRRGDGKTSPWPCDLCGAYNTVDMFTMVCSMCLSCNECHQASANCQCYTPERYRQEHGTYSKELVVIDGQVRELSDIDR